MDPGMPALSPIVLRVGRKGYCLRCPSHCPALSQAGTLTRGASLNRRRDILVFRDVAVQLYHLLPKPISFWSWSVSKTLRAYWFPMHNPPFLFLEIEEIWIRPNLLSNARHLRGRDTLGRSPGFPRKSSSRKDLRGCYIYLVMPLGHSRGRF